MGDLAITTSQQPLVFGGQLVCYFLMYLLTMFDLPSKTKAERRIYRRFRKVLLALGYTRIQFSVYIKAIENSEQAKTIKKCVLKALPKRGNVRLLLLSAHVYDKMETGRFRADGESRKLFDIIAMLAQSLVKFYAKETETLYLPILEREDSAED